MTLTMLMFFLRACVKSPFSSFRAERSGVEESVLTDPSTQFTLSKVEWARGDNKRIPNFSHTLSKNSHSLPAVFHYLSELEAWSSEAGAPGSSGVVWEAGSSIIDMSVVYSG